jgi:hypothetical protein
MQKVRILLYTDFSKINDNPDPNLETWGLSELKKFVEYKTRGLIEVEFDFISRHVDKQQLTQTFLRQYEEIWMYGMLIDEGPPWELDILEVRALKEWMDNGGGLFFTGDHSVPLTSDGCKGDHKKFITLGASLGRFIKRAGELRVWDGPPTGCAGGRRDNHNTQEGRDPSQLDEPHLDEDNTPQTLLDMPDPPHRLFWWRIEADGCVIPIQQFPDHGHEGQLLVPERLSGDWPPGSPPPVVAARGKDKRFPDNSRLYDLVVAYDGDPVNVGRIVVDSSFHHYFNVNLRQLPDRNANGYPVPGSILDQVAQYYGNLALWLAPKTIRDQIKDGLLFRAAEHPDIFEVRGNDSSYLGKVARHALELEIGYSNLYRILAPSEFESEPRFRDETRDEILALICLRRNTYLEFTQGEHEIVLGSMVKAYHEYFMSRGIADPGLLKREPPLPAMLERGFTLLLDELPDLDEKLQPLRERL